jgi:transcriptional regulator with XRE-family HTH domain
MMDELLEAKRLAARLRRIRLERGLSLRGAAAKIGVTKETLSDLERARRQPHPPTLAKIAEGYGVEISDLLGPMVEEEPVPLAETPPPPGPASLEEGPPKKGEWREAVDEARDFRTRAPERLEWRLSAWKTAKAEGADEGERREILDEVGFILDEADDVVRKLQRNMQEGLDNMGTHREGPNPYWEEFLIAESLYRELLGMVGDAGLSVRPKKPHDEAGSWKHELEDAA